MYEEQLDHLLKCWKKAFGKYRGLKAEAEQAVVRWEWTTGERHSVLPFHFSRFPGRGRVLKDDPNTAGYFHQYGFDQYYQVRVERRYQYRTLNRANFLQRMVPDSDLTKDLYSETFTRYSEETIESVEYSVSPHIPLSVRQIFLENREVIFHAYFRLNGYTSRYGEKGRNPDEFYEWLGYNGRFKTAEAYVYEENRLHLISGFYEAPGVHPYTAEEHFSYDDSGKLLRIDRIDQDGQEMIVYRKHAKGQTFQLLQEETAQKLVDSVIQTVQAAKIQERIYCLVLNYQQVTQHFPPVIIAAPESYRLKLLQSGDLSERFCIFLPVLGNEWFFHIKDPETLEKCQVLEQEIKAGEKWSTATKILRDVAATLTRHDWNDIMNVTPDFVVFAFDPEVEGDRMVEVLSSSVSKKQVVEWMEKGWLV